MVFGNDDTIKRTPASVRDELARQAGHLFDPRVVLAIVEYLELMRREQLDTRTVRIALHILQPGMTLARDLLSAQGTLLMPRDTLLTITHVERIRNFARVEQLGAIFVYSADAAP